ncbi:FAD-binding protein [Sphaerotilus microaerophilus]|uniref:23S rRNA methyltransferase n=1 Tax=Sphaerotilus microaerophilus TaxID=2914710 RepID=A0ABM7YNX4_9BURK|nr:FAD-binding protein [Sphaerotilus sp. FB-5]BDI06186.1 23S rRNA methyltransferase [Sphaerotilus sp. FB-5]
MSQAAGAAPRTSTVTPIEPALEVEDATAVDWSERAEILVIGWGAAGACAAIEARSAGADVLVIDRFNGGGASALSGGVVYAGGGTAQQREAGFADSPEAMAEYLRHETQGVVSDATLQRFCADSVANLQWLEAQGVRFASAMPPHKTSYPPDGFYLYYSGNEVVPACQGECGPPAPRGHRAVAQGQSGATLYAALQAATLRSGARTLTQATVRRLVRERGRDGQPGRVLGVELWQLPPGDARTARHAELDRQVARWRTLRPGKAAALRREAARVEQACAQPRFVRATRAVLLCTGGFIYNPALIQAHAPHTRRGWPVGGAGCDGSGLRLGQSVGAAADRLNNISAWRFITPPSVWPKGLVVNAQGERFCNEQVYGEKLGHELVEHQGGRGWLLLDGALRWQAIRQCLFGGLWGFQAGPALAMMLFAAKKAATPEVLAARIGADPQRLRASIEAANAAARGERDDPMGKSPDMRHEMVRGPYLALDISIGSPLFPLAVLTLGGLVVDETTGQVRDASGGGIPGLYAAGRTAIGLPSSRYVSGLSLADCVFSGRRAGRAAAIG